MNISVCPGRRSCAERSCEHQAACEDCVEAWPGDCRSDHPPDDTGEGDYRRWNADIAPFRPGHHAGLCATEG